MRTINRHLKTNCSFESVTWGATGVTNRYGTAGVYKDSNCLTLDGLSMYVNYGNLGYSSNTTSTNIILEGRFVKTSAYNVILFYMSKGDGSLEVLTQVDASLRFNTSANGYWYTAANILSANTEYHFVFSFDSTAGTASLTLNDSTVSLTHGGSDSTTTAALISNLNYYVGIRSGTVNFFGGSVYGVKVTVGGTVIVDSTYSCGVGDFIFNRVNSNYGIVQNYNAATCWATKQQSYHANITLGYNVGSVAIASYNHVQYQNLSLDVLNKSYDCSFYVRFSSTGSVQVPMAYQNYSGNTIRFVPIDIVGGNFCVYYGVSGGGSKTLMTADTNIHLVRWTSDRTNYRIYIDGVLKDTTAIAGALTSGFSVFSEFSNVGRTTLANSANVFLYNYSLYEDSVLKQELIVDKSDGIFYESVTNAKLTSSGTVAKTKYLISCYLNASLDCLGVSIKYPSGNYHNQAETLVTLSGNTIYTPNAAVSNPTFLRKTLAYTAITRRIDRLLIYATTRTGNALARINTYVTTINI